MMTAYGRFRRFAQAAVRMEQTQLAQRFQVDSSSLVLYTFFVSNGLERMRQGLIK